MKYVLSKYDKAQMYLLHYMLKSNLAIVLYDLKKVYMPTKKYNHLACSINYFHKNLEEIGNISFSKYFENDKYLLQTLKEIQSLKLKASCTPAEINDYIRVIKEYHLQKEKEKLIKMVSLLNKGKITLNQYFNEVQKIQELWRENDEQI